MAPTATVPRFKELADRVTGELELLPVPLRLTVCGLLPALSVKASVPVAAPVAVGVNVTPTLQLAPAATLVPQVLVAIPKGPLTVMAENTSNPLWLLVSVTDLAELVEPTAVVLKLKDVADSVTGALPVPVRLTVCGLLIALSANVSVPVAAPNAAGVKVTPTLQVAPAAMPVPQVLLDMANGEVTEMPVNVSAVLSRFVTVTVFATLVLPIASVPKLNWWETKYRGAAVACEATGLRAGDMVMVRTPEAEPAATGENTTEMVQEPAGAMLPLQVLVWLNGPVTATLVTCRGLCRCSAR